MRYLPFGFNKQEFSVVSLILAVLVVAIFVNLQNSYRKSRDMRRKEDVRAVHDALMAFHNDFAYFPASDEQGRILACLTDTVNPPLDELGNVIYEPCNWGEDAFRDVFDTEYSPYITSLPSDPHTDQGVRYRYISNGTHFQLYASLEGEGEAEYDEKIVNRSLSCGTRICNFGRSFSTTPLDISLEEYENDIRAK